MMVKSIYGSLHAASKPIHQLFTCFDRSRTSTKIKKILLQLLLVLLFLIFPHKQQILNYFHLPHSCRLLNVVGQLVERVTTEFKLFA